MGLRYSKRRKDADLFRLGLIRRVEHFLFSWITQNKPLCQSISDAGKKNIRIDPNPKMLFPALRNERSSVFVPPCFLFLLWRIILSLTMSLTSLLYRIAKSKTSTSISLPCMYKLKLASCFWLREERRSLLLKCNKDWCQAKACLKDGKYDLWVWACLLC